MLTLFYIFNKSTHLSSNKTSINVNIYVIARRSQSKLNSPTNINIADRPYSLLACLTQLTGCSWQISLPVTLGLSAIQNITNFISKFTGTNFGNTQFHIVTLLPSLVKPNSTL